MTKTLVRFLQINKRTRATRSVWVKTVSYKDGPGMQVHRVAFTATRTEAAEFSLATAQQIAEQYFTSAVVLERTDGTLPEAENAAVQATCAAKRAQAAANRRQENEFWAEVIDAVPELKNALVGLARTR